MQFRHERIDSNPPSGRLSFCLTEDLTGNGRDDVVVGAMGDPKNVSFLGRSVPLRAQKGIGDVIKRLECNLFWYENPGWKRHEMADVTNLDVGAAFGDVTGDGRNDLVAGQGIGHTDLYWFERPSDPREKWEKRLITDGFEKYHDVAVADVDGDGENEVVGLSQESETVFYYDIPDRPRRTPWPDTHRHVVAEGIEVEGIQVADVDGDGRDELLAGPNVFRPTDGPDERWRREQIAPDWKWTRTAVADVDGDGELEVLLAEGDRPYADGELGRVGWFDPPEWEPHVLGDEFFCPHTLQVADFTGDGLPDIYTAEMGLGENDRPVHYLFWNRGDGEFERKRLFRGIPTHEAKAVDLTGDGRTDIVGKSYTPTHHVDVWYNEK